jgi:hypothetical protein
VCVYLTNFTPSFICKSPKNKINMDKCKTF